MAIINKTLEYIVPRIVWILLLLVGAYLLLKKFAPGVLELWTQV
ncbi:hypothetical protein LCGC14_0439070 [marine sediment metagenome]|uniref:Uncharacterized protein n=1 Tax=marine sediment metagenome TaxID=412755 RepID=A0A0F9SRR1_9ZZZZ